MSSLLRHVIKHRGAFVLWSDNLTKADSCTLVLPAKTDSTSMVYILTKDMLQETPKLNQSYKVSYKYKLYNVVM